MLTRPQIVDIQVRRLCWLSHESNIYAQFFNSFLELFVVLFDMQPGPILLRNDTTSSIHIIPIHLRKLIHHRRQYMTDQELPVLRGITSVILPLKCASWTILQVYLHGHKVSKMPNSDLSIKVFAVGQYSRMSNNRQEYHLSNIWLFSHSTDYYVSSAFAELQCLQAPRSEQCEDSTL